MLSLGARMRPEALHTFVDTFVERKKVQVKQQLRQAMETVLDDLFDEMLNQLKDMLLPALGADRPDTGTGGGHQAVEAEAPKETRPKSPPSPPLVFAVKSKPGPSRAQPPGWRRDLPLVLPSPTAEKRPVEDQASSDQHQEAIIATKKARTEPNENAAVLDFEPQNNSDDDNSGPAPPPPVHEPLAKFVCSSPGCGKRFKKSSGLKDHERLHSGVAPFSCKFPGCSHSGKVRSGILRHIRSVHLKHLEPGQEDDPKKYLEVNEELLK